MVGRVRVLKPPGSEREWQVRMHGAITVSYSTLCLKEKDQSCHHEVWVHLLHVNARLVDLATRNDRSRKLNLKKRISPYDHSKEKGGLVQKRPFARGTGHPYDLLCFHEQWSDVPLPRTLGWNNIRGNGNIGADGDDVPSGRN